MALDALGLEYNPVRRKAYFGKVAWTSWKNAPESERLAALRDVEAGVVMPVPSTGLGDAGKSEIRREYLETWVSLSLGVN